MGPNCFRPFARIVGLLDANGSYIAIIEKANVSTPYMKTTQNALVDEGITCPLA